MAHLFCYAFWRGQTGSRQKNIFQKSSYIHPTSIIRACYMLPIPHRVQENEIQCFVQNPWTWTWTQKHLEIFFETVWAQNSKSAIPYYGLIINVFYRNRTYVSSYIIHPSYTYATCYRSPIGYRYLKIQASRPEPPDRETRAVDMQDACSVYRVYMQHGTNPPLGTDI